MSEATHEIAVDHHLRSGPCSTAKEAVQFLMVHLPEDESTITFISIDRTFKPTPVDGSHYSYSSSVHYEENKESTPIG